MKLEYLKMAPEEKRSVLRVTFHSARKAPPVGEHHQRQVLAVKVRNGLGSFKG